MMPAHQTHQEAQPVAPTRKQATTVLAATVAVLLITLGVAVLLAAKHWSPPHTEPPGFHSGEARTFSQ